MRAKKVYEFEQTGDLHKSLDIGKNRSDAIVTYTIYNYEDNEPGYEDYDIEYLFYPYAEDDLDHYGDLTLTGTKENIDSFLEDYGLEGLGDYELNENQGFQRSGDLHKSLNIGNDKTPSDFSNADDYLDYALTIINRNLNVNWGHSGVDINFGGYVIKNMDDRSIGLWEEEMELVFVPEENAEDEGYWGWNLSNHGDYEDKKTNWDSIKSIEEVIQKLKNTE